jgi:VWFA-related protein
VAVTDSKGNYVSGLNPADFSISEDGIAEKVASFEEGNTGPRIVADDGEAGRSDTAAPNSAAPAVVSAPQPIAPQAPGHQPIEPSAAAPEAVADAGGASGTLADGAPGLGALNGASVFILFDTSNYMYRRSGFVFAQDSMSDFVRSLDGPSRVAFYSYSNNLTKEALLTAERSNVLQGIRTAVNGAESALYNAMLLTLRDAAKVAGKKVLVVFTNGPDNASTVSPEEVAELAQSVGIPVYMISTQEAKLDPVSSVVFTRMSANTGGEAYFAKTWKDENHAFSAIREDLAHLYVLSYYPQPNPNRNWRKITVKLLGKNEGRYTVRTRSGYRPIVERASFNNAPEE